MKGRGRRGRQGGEGEGEEEGGFSEEGEEEGEEQEREQEVERRRGRRGRRGGRGGRRQGRARGEEEGPRACLAEPWGNAHSRTHHYAHPSLLDPQALAGPHGPRPQVPLCVGPPAVPGPWTPLQGAVGAETAAVAVEGRGAAAACQASTGAVRERPARAGRAPAWPPVYPWGAPRPGTPWGPPWGPPGEGERGGVGEGTPWSQPLGGPAPRAGMH